VILIEKSFLEHAQKEFQKFLKIRITLFRYEQQKLYFLTFLTVEHSKIRKMPEVFFGTPENVPNYFAKKYF